MYKKLACCFLLWALATAAHAENFSESDGLQPDSAQQMFSEDQNAAAIQHYLEKVEKLYGEKAAVLKSLQHQIEQQNGNLQKIGREITATQQELAVLQKELATQMRIAYAFGQQEKLKLLLNQQDPALSSRMMKYFGYFNKDRLEKVAKVVQTIQTLDSLYKQNETQRDQLGRDKAQRQAEQYVLDKVRKQRDELLAKSPTFGYSEEQRMQLLADNEKSLRSFLTSLHVSVNLPAKPYPESGQADTPNHGQVAAEDDFPVADVNFSELKGKLPWPVKKEGLRKTLPV